MKTEREASEMLHKVDHERGMRTFEDSKLEAISDALHWVLGFYSDSVITNYLGQD